MNLGSSRQIGSQDRSAGVGNDLTRYEQLAFLCFGKGSCEFSDDLGVELTIQNGQLRGWGIQDELLVECAGLSGHDVQLFERFVSAKTVEVE